MKKPVDNMAKKPAPPERAPRFDILMEQWAELTAPYATGLPFSKARGINDAVPLPDMDGPYIRAQQKKQRHRYQTAHLAAGRDFPWQSEAAAFQAFQGGFMLNDVRLPDRDRLAKNPILALHGTANRGGKLQFSHLIPRDIVIKQIIPVVRTDSSDQQVYTVATEGSESATLRRQLHDGRKPYTEARVQRDRRKPGSEVLVDLIKKLDASGRTQDANEVKAVTAKTPGDREIDRWLKSKHEDYKRQMDAAGVPNTENRQALRGYEVIPFRTLVSGRMIAIDVEEYQAGLMALAFYQRNPTLGGHAAMGCGAYLRSVYRVSVSGDPDEPPMFDCLLKVEPFKPLQVCLDDHDVAKIDKWDVFENLTWLPIRGSNCFISRAVAAWDAIKGDKARFDLNFVPRAAVKEVTDVDEE